MQYKYVILDDDSKSILKTQSEMESFSNFSCVGTASNYENGLNLILKSQPDIIFLEINPRVKSSNLSLLLINELHRYLNQVPKIIAISHDTALTFDALKYDVTDFLVKPVLEVDLRKTFLRLEKNLNFENTSKIFPGKTEEKNELQTLEKSNFQNSIPIIERTIINENIQLLKEEISNLKENLQNNSTPNNITIDHSLLTELIIETISKNLPVEKEIDWSPLLNKMNEFVSGEKLVFEDREENQRKLICIKSYGDYRFLELNDLAYLQADNNSTDITLKNGDQITAFKTLKYFEENLPSNFYRIHNSYIVNKDYISRIHTGNSLCYIKNTKSQIPFSKSYKENIDLILAQLAGSEFKDS